MGKNRIAYKLFFPLWQSENNKNTGKIGHGIVMVTPLHIYRPIIAS